MRKKKRNDRIIYYEKDLMTGYNLAKAEKVLLNFNESIQFDINDILEFYNIKKYFDNKIYLTSWDNQTIEKYKLKIKVLAKHISIFKNSITESNIEQMFNLVDSNYRNDFFEIFNYFKLYEKISGVCFKKIIENNISTLVYVLIYKDMVNYYDFELRNIILIAKSSAELLIKHYALKSSSNSKALYWPNSLTVKDKESIIINYAQSEKSHINYLEKIINIADAKDFYISPQTKLLIKNKCDEEIKKYFSHNVGLKLGVQITFGKYEKVIDILQESDEVKLFYDEEWINLNLDYPTLLNNFIYLFGYVDDQMRINLISKENDLGIFEKTLIVRSKNEYIMGSSFSIKEMMGHLQIIAYNNFLESQNISIEDIIMFFFNSYLLKEFYIDGFNIKLFKDKSSYEKCKSIFPEIEKILKLYNIFVDNKILNKDLIPFYNAPLFSQCKSLATSYIYLNNDDRINQIMFLLFSDQCTLSFIDSGKEYDSFFKLLKNEVVNKNKIEEFNIDSLNLLIKENIVFINQENNIEFKNKNIVRILFDLYSNDFISYNNCSKSDRLLINQMIQNGYLLKKEQLFSDFECDYFDYYLNNHKFDNSLAIRNKYLHGNVTNEKEDVNNYFLTLKVFILIILKMNDDLRNYFDDIENKNIVE